MLNLRSQLFFLICFNVTCVVKHFLLLMGNTNIYECIQGLYKCPSCHKRFHYPKILSNHQLVHNKKLYLKCDVCGCSRKYPMPVNGPLYTILYFVHFSNNIYFPHMYLTCNLHTSYFHSLHMYIPHVPESAFIIFRKCHNEVCN